MFDTAWPTHILKTNIGDNDSCEQLFQYLLSTYGNEWPNSFSQKDIFTHPEHKNSIFDIVQVFITNNVKSFFQETFGTIPNHIIRTFATNHSNIGVHQHQGSLVSGIFYVYCTAGDLRLHDPRANAQRGYPNQLQHYFQPKVIQPKIGDIIMFPSFLQHEVTNNFSKEPRVIMPFDVFGDLDNFG